MMPGEGMDEYVRETLTLGTRISFQIVADSTRFARQQLQLP